MAKSLINLLAINEIMDYGLKIPPPNLGSLHPTEGKRTNYPDRNRSPTSSAQILAAFYHNCFPSLQVNLSRSLCCGTRVSRRPNITTSQEEWV